jgi:hypothetical protein
MSIVYVLGAGASYGEVLHQMEGVPAREIAGKRAPLANGFFSEAVLRSVGHTIEELRRDFPEALDYIGRLFSIPANDAAPWENIDIEAVFTSIELDREFCGIESDYGAHCVLVRNKLLRCIFRILSLCTQGFSGEYSHTLASNLGAADSIVTFNWDLLMDQELYFRPYRSHYNSFLAAALQYTEDDPFVFQEQPPDGMFLKMHGSMNWFQCTNAKCPASKTIVRDVDFQGCLLRLMGMHWKDELCMRCGSSTEPLIIPPLLQKPIADNWIVRSAWGLARKKLHQADVVVVVGFSAPPTDFYASWLLRSTVGLREEIPVLIVNRDNGKPEFDAKMKSIFPNASIRTFQSVSEINAVLTAAKEADRFN